MPGTRRTRSRRSVGPLTVLVLARWASLQADLDPGCAHPLLRLPHAVVPVVEDRGAEDGVGAALLDGVDEMVQGAGATRRDHRDVHGIGHRPGELELVAALRAVAVHAREQDLPRPALHALACPLDGVAPHGRAATVDVDAVVREGAGGPRTGAMRIRSVLLAPRVDRQ